MSDHPVPFDPTCNLWNKAPWLNSKTVDPRDGKLRPDDESTPLETPRPKTAFVRSKGLPCRESEQTREHFVPQVELEPVYLTTGMENAILCDEMRLMEEEHQFMVHELKRAAKERKRLLSVISQLTSVLQQQM